MAYQGHLIIPTTHPDAESIIEQIEAQMAIRYGGYSRYEGNGGWESDDGIETEDHVRLVVTTDDVDRDELRDYLRIEAMYVKDMLDEDAVLIEIQETDMVLV